YRSCLPSWGWIVPSPVSLHKCYLCGGLHFFMAHFTLLMGIIFRFLSVPRPRAVSRRAQLLDLWKSVEHDLPAGANGANFYSNVRPPAAGNLHESRWSRNDCAQTIEKG